MSRVVLPSSFRSHPGVVVPVGIDPAGLTGPTPARAKGPSWRRVAKGLYVPAAVDQQRLDQLIVEAASLLPSIGGVTGWAALAWMGGRWFDGTRSDGTALDVPIAVSHANVRQRPGVWVSKENLPPSERVFSDGLPVTTAVRSVLYEVRRSTSLRQAVRALDMAAYSDLVSLPEVLEYAEKLYAWTGIPRARTTFGHMEENSWSPRETDMRLLWTEHAGFRRPWCNRPVFDRRGRHVGTPDLIDPVVGVVGEYDGSLHLADDRHGSDVARDARYRALGLEPVIMVRSDLRRPEDFVTRLHQAFDRARAAPRADRGWSLDPPEGWVPTHTVAHRRALTDDQRVRLLAYRGA